MKLLPCSTPSCHGRATLPDGAPYYIGRAPTTIASTPRFQYRCATCKRPQYLTVTQWHRLPDTTLADLDADGLARKMLGPDVSDDQVADLVTAAVDLSLLTGRA